MIAQYYDPARLSVDRIRNKGGTLAFYQIIKRGLGTGTFGEGMFKPLLTIPVNQNEFV